MTDSTSDPLTNVDVEVFTSGGVYVASSYTASDGTYTITGLASGTYDVCFQSQFASGGTSTTGYVSQCYSNVAWNGYSYDVSGATGVQVTAGSTTSGINAVLSDAGGISGTVDDSSSNPLSDVEVEVLTQSGTYLSESYTLSDGTYSVVGLAPGTYDVCFYVSTDNEPTGGSSTTGYLDQCYNDVSWNGYLPPSGATTVQVTAGSTTSNVNAALADGGAISGTVDDTGSNALNDVEVEVFGIGSQNVGTEYSGYSEPDGTYSVLGIPTGTYNVCFNPYQATGGSSTTGYLDQCYNDVSWNGNSLSPGGTSVPVSAGTTTSGVDGVPHSGRGHFRYGR